MRSHRRRTKQGDPGDLAHPTTALKPAGVNGHHLRCVDAYKTSRCSETSLRFCPRQEPRLCQGWNVQPVLPHPIHHALRPDPPNETIPTLPPSSRFNALPLSNMLDALPLSSRFDAPQLSRRLDLLQLWSDCRSLISQLASKAA